MVSLKLTEEGSDRLVFQVGACAMLGQSAICVFVVSIVAFSLTYFLRHYFGLFLAMVIIGLPGLVGVVCGFFGCANARQFTFCFDRTAGEFRATAGSAQFVRPLSQIRLVHIERELGGGGALGGDSAPCFAVAVMFFDNRRCRLDGGVAATGSGHGPEQLREHAERIRAFLGLPQEGVPMLNISKASKQEEDEEQTRFHLSRWLACQGLAPRLDPPLRTHDWAEQPRGVSAPRAGPQSLSQRYGAGAPAGGPVAEGAPVSQVVIGRPQLAQRARSLEVAVPEGMPGQNMSVRAPDGTILQCMVPADMRPGEVMTLQY